MPRDPAMHILLSDFTDILANNGLANPKKLALRIFQQAVPLNIRNRYMVPGDDKTKQKADKAIKAAKSADMTVERFNRILDAERRKAGHMHITPIRRDSTTFLLLKEIAIMAAEFTHNVGIENIDEGCQTYIQLGLEKMRHSRNYALGKFKYYDDAIYKQYESLDMLAHDKEPELTQEFHDVYIRLLAEYAGITRDLSKPEDYVCFIFTKIEAQKVGADSEDWIRAQFEELGRAFDSIPNPNQLFTDAATGRYWRYFRIPKEEQETAININWDKSSDFEQRYNEKLKQKLANK